MIAASADLLVNPWRFQAHPEVWLLASVLLGAYVYAVRVIGPVAVKSGLVTTRKQKIAFAVAILML